MTSVKTISRINAKMPEDSALKLKFKEALEAVAAIYPVNGQEPSRTNVVSEAVLRINAAGFGRFDPDDGTDFAQTMADAYFAVRADVVARTAVEAGNA